MGCVEYVCVYVECVFLGVCVCVCEVKSEADLNTKYLNIALSQHKTEEINQEKIVNVC